MARRDPTAAPPPAPAAPSAPSSVAASLGTLRFEENVGQFDPRARFVARSSGMTSFITDDGVMLALRDGDRTDAISLRVAGARAAQVDGEARLAVQSHYFLGADPQRWRTHVPNYAQVRQRGVLPGVAVVYHADPDEPRRLEYDVVLSPGVDPGAVEMEIEGGDDLRVLDDGSLEVPVGKADLRQPTPRVYQEDGAGHRRMIRARYKRVGPRRIGFEIAAFDRHRDLVIDPVLVYSTLLGGTSGVSTERANGIAVDATGAAYIAMQTPSADMPATAGAFATTVGGSNDAFVAKLAPGGTSLVYATYIGGTGGESANAIAVDGAGAAYIVGGTLSTDFPTQGAFQAAPVGAVEAFATKLGPAGDALTYSTYLGGAEPDVATAAAVDGSGVLTLVGRTSSDNFPTKNAAQPALANPTTTSDAFVTRLAANGGSLVFSTYLGGSASDTAGGVAVDGDGAAYIGGSTASIDFPILGALQPNSGGGGSDVFVTKLDNAGARVFGTYLGGSGFDEGGAIAVDGTKAVYVTGDTSSSDYPTQGAFQPTRQGQTSALVTKLSAAGNSLVYSTYLGGPTGSVGPGSGAQFGVSIGVDSANSAHVLVTVQSTDFPVVNPFQATAASDSDVGVVRFSPSGSTLLHSTYFGGGAAELPTSMAVTPEGAEYVVGATRSADFPRKIPARDAGLTDTEDGFVFQLLPSDAGASDAGDAGDAGSTDAGDAGSDAGPTDAGSGDAGSGDAGSDAGPADAGPKPIVDASVVDASAATSDDYAGGGGCSCRVESTTATDRSLLAASTVLALAMSLVRRRRRGKREEG